MGYTHYYSVEEWQSASWQAIWPGLTQDASLIMAAANVPICGSCFNDQPLASVEQGIYFNGLWDDSHESFILSSSIHQNQWCKTVRKPYDIVVCCILLRAYVLAPQCIHIASDGDWIEPEWRQARELYHSLWPQDALPCPWKATDESEESHYNVSAEDSPPVSQTLSHTEASADSQGAKSHALPPARFDEARATVSHLDLAQITALIAACETDPDHDACGSSVFDPPNLPGVCFRLVDVQRRCVVTAPGDTAFVALTYVWGGAQQLRLSLETAPDLMQDGSLIKFWAQLSTTVRDAIMVCEELGERYLWTDTLCIMQDLWQDMRIQINWMRQIYMAAKCTIAAVSASAADMGLIVPGSFQDQSLRSEASLNAMIEDSPWNGRGWCYQEKVFSHRVLLFTCRGVYLQCQEGTFDIHANRLQSVNIQPTSKYDTCGALLSIATTSDLEAFVSAVECFSHRRLGISKDRKDAFEGIFRRFANGLDGYRSSFYFGLPVSSFDQTFCWRATTHRPGERIPLYPSWSWLGWNVPVTFDRDVLQHARTKQMIYRDDDGDYQAASHSHITILNELRKPASRAEYWTPEGDPSEFGFPATRSSRWYGTTLDSIDASISKLLICKTPKKLDGAEGCYSVFPIWCEQQRPGPSPCKDTYEESCFRKALTQAWAMRIPLDDFITNMPTPQIASDDHTMRSDDDVRVSVVDPQKNRSLYESVRGPRPRLDRTRLNMNLNQHQQHGKCEAQRPLGYIWLNRAWREQRSDECVMDFMALTGVKDLPSLEWTISTLMLLEEVQCNGLPRSYERVQVMDTGLRLEQWLLAGAETITVRLS